MVYITFFAYLFKNILIKCPNLILNFPPYIRLPEKKKFNLGRTIFIT